MDEDVKTTNSMPTYKWVKSKENTPEIYANVVNASWTLVDVRFRIGQLVPADSNTTSDFVCDESAGVTVAWPYVKILRDTLVELIASYERANGEIKPVKLPHPGAPSTAE